MEFQWMISWLGLVQIVAAQCFLTVGLHKCIVDYCKIGKHMYYFWLTTHGGPEARPAENHRCRPQFGCGHYIGRMWFEPSGIDTDWANVTKYTPTTCVDTHLFSLLPWCIKGADSQLASCVLSNTRVCPAMTPLWNGSVQKWIVTCGL